MKFYGLNNLDKLPEILFIDRRTGQVVKKEDLIKMIDMDTKSGLFIWEGVYNYERMEDRERRP